MARPEPRRTAASFHVPRSRVRRAAQAALLLAALTSLACQGFPFGSRIQTPEVAVANVTPVMDGGLAPRARVDLTLSNPNDVDLEIHGMRFELELNGRRFAAGQTPELVTIPRLGEASVSVLVTTGLGDLLGQLSGVGVASGFRYDIYGDLFLEKPELRTLRFRYSSDS